MSKGGTPVALTFVAILFGAMIGGLTILIRWLFGEIMDISWFASGENLNVFLHILISTTVVMMKTFWLVSVVLKKMGTSTKI